MTQESSAFPVRRPPLITQVIEYLQGQITSGVYPVGARLPGENELSVRLNVGRSTLREAMRVLVHAGVVEVRPGDGTYVCTSLPETVPLQQQLRRAQVADVSEVRDMLDVECARAAALRHHEEDLTHLRQLLQERQAALETSQLEAFIDSDIRFHLAVAEATRNTVLISLYRTFAVVLREVFEVVLREPVQEADRVFHFLAENQALHVELVEALAERKPDQAQQIMRNLQTSTRQQFFPRTDQKAVRPLE